MATRRTSAPERIAGDILGFTTEGQVEESQSVLAKYFPELSLRLPAKGARGMRLGRGPQIAEQVITYTPKEAVAPAAPAAPALPDYSSQFADLKQSLLSQSQEISSLRSQLQSQTAKPPGQEVTTKPPVQQETSTKPYTPTYELKTPEAQQEQAKGVVTKLYQEYLGRTPDEPGLKYWLEQDPLSQGGITPQEETVMRKSFEAQPETTKVTVGKAYQTAFGREADEPGLQYWSQQYKPGTDVETVKEQLISSAKQAAPSSEDRIRIAYKEALGKEADPEGLKYWSQAGASETDFEKFKNQLRVAAGLA